MKYEKVLFRRFERCGWHDTRCLARYDSFDDIWYTTGLYGFGNIEKRIRIPYSIDFLLDYFGDDLLSIPSLLTYDSNNNLVGLKNGNKFIRFFTDKKVFYSDKFINKIMKDNFGVSS